MPKENLLSATGGLNTDDSPLNFVSGEGDSAFLHGDYRYALNVRIGNTSFTNAGSVESIPSTVVTNNYYVWTGTDWVSGSAPTGTNVAINKFEDRTEGKIYWFVKNSNGHDLILMFSRTDGKIYELLKWDGLNFSNFISVTKINKYLIFSDGNPSDGTGNPPRIIDVTSIYSLYYTLGSNFNEFHISFSKWAPVAPPMIDAAGQADGNVFIKEGLYQFSYRYIYIGGFRSTWSPPSNFVSNKLNATANVGFAAPLQATQKNFGVNTIGYVFDYGNPGTIITPNNAFNHTDVRFYSFVDTIEYAYRDSSYASWKVFSRVQLNGAAPSTDITFANSGPIYNVADSDINQYYDSVPLLSASVEAIDNRPMFGNNLDDLEPMTGFNVTDIAVYSVKSTDDNWFDLSAVKTLPDIAALIARLKFQKFSFKENGIYKLGIIFKHYSGRSGLVQTLDKWTYTIPAMTPAGDAAQENFHALGFKIDTTVLPPDWAVDYQIVRSNCLNIDMFIVGQVNDFKFLQIDPSTDSSISTSQQIQDAISNYYDNYNTGGAQYPVISRILSAVRKNQTVATSSLATLIYIDITNWTLDSKVNTGQAANPSNNVYYNWQPGDRVRFWGSTASNFLGAPFVQYDQEIIEYTGTSLIVSKPPDLTYMGGRTSAAGGNGANSVILFSIEVYRPKKYSTENDVIFYEMGEWYPINNPMTAERQFSKTDFTWIGSASALPVTGANGFKYVTNYPIVNGDVWLVYKNFFYNWAGSSPSVLDMAKQGYLGPYNNPFSPTPFMDMTDYPIYPQMTPDKNNAAGVWEHNTGRPLVAYTYFPKQPEKYTQIRFGGKFLEDSIFIGINNFQDQNQKIYPSEYGKIRAMVNTSNTQVKDVGQILMVMCEEETMDIYVNRATLQQLGGQTQVSLSDQVLGSYNTLLGSLGCINPESVSKRNSRVLFWNARQGRWIRRSTDGLTAISDYKMYNWFNEISLLLLDTYATSTPAKVISMYDNYYDEWITRFDHSSLPSTFRGYASYKCCSFNEEEKRWKAFYDFAPDLFAAFDNNTFSIIGTVVHEHWQGNDFNSIYGSKKDSMIQFYANQEMRRQKTWHSIGILSTDGWSAESVDGDFRSNNVTQQLSSLLLTDFDNREDMYWADFKRDQNTPNAGSTDVGLANGDIMRARALRVLLKLDPSVTWYSLLNWVAVYYNDSELTIKK